MTPLDLRQRPPRDPRERLAGLMMLPRTIDKARALLPGGERGAYFISPGLSAWLLGKLKLTEAEFLDIVRLADDERNVAAAIGEHADAARIAHLNGTLESLRVSQITGEVRELFLALYGADTPQDALVIDVLADDDRAMFPAPGALD